jgi:putative ABC transport system permease protein
MNIFSTIMVALRALRRNKMRSILTALGIIIGVGAVIAMVSIGDGARYQVEASIASLGENIIIVFNGSFTSGGARGGYGSAGTLTVDDAKAIADQIHGVSIVCPEARSQNQVLANGLNWFTSISGEGEDYLTMRQWPLSEGTMFDDQEVRSDAKVCVVGQTIVNNLFPDGEAVGKTLRIRNIPFKILGVLQAKGFSVQGNDQDDVVIVPYTSCMKRIARQPNLRGINVQAESSSEMPAIEKEITNLLRDRHHITPGKEDDFTVRDQQELADAFSQTAQTMTVLLGAIAGVSLIVGGIGIMNIMLVSVTERTREIGIRMAVGAHGSDVLTQFLIEAVMLSLMGGTLGILTGVGTAHLLTVINHWPTLVSPTSVIVAFVFSGAVGVFFGFYPARQAAKLDPIDALRYE